LKQNIASVFFIGLLFFNSPLFAAVKVVDAIATDFSSDQIVGQQEQDELPKVVHVSTGPAPVCHLADAERQKLLAQIKSLEQTNQDLHLLLKQQKAEPNVSTQPKISNDSIKLTDSTVPDDEQAYQAADKLAQTQQSRKAIHALEQFIKKYPQSTYMSAAYYSLARLEESTGKIQHSVNHLVMIVKNYAQAKEVPDAMLALGFIAKNQHQLPQANAWFKKVIQSYPNSTQAQTAQTQLRQLP
jgi:tol-pal system protein YbgF